MTNRRRTWWMAMSLVLASSSALAGEVRFTATDADIANPERGFYRAAPSGLDALDPGWLDEVFAQGTRLVYVPIDLSRHRTGPIPADVLTKLDAGFATARRAGVKLIIRAVYNDPRGETGYRSAQDAPMPVVLGHLRQLKPLLARNVDVIAYVQAGLIGAWGEWHTSSNGLTTPAARAHIRDALLAAVPAQRSVQFRYPPDLDGWMPARPSGATRLGFHNDCFLASQTDVGTYPDEAPERERLRTRMAALTAQAPFGGETCNPADDPGAIPRVDCADILREGAQFHLTFLNADYYRRLFHDRWRAQGCLDEVRRRLGYRLALLSARADASAARGGSLRLGLSLRNDGWARLTNARPLDVVLIGEGTVYRLATSGADPRDWLSGHVTDIDITAPIPASLPSGRYALALALPDADDRLRDSPRYAVRVANADDLRRGQRWDEHLGAFRTGLTVDVR